MEDYQELIVSVAVNTQELNMTIQSAYELMKEIIKWKQIQNYKKD